MKKTLLTLSLCINTSLYFTSCDSPSAMLSQNNQETLVLQVNVTPAQSAQQASQVQILDIQKLPASIRDASEVRVVFDNSGSSVSAIRQANGTLSFPLSTGRSFDSNNALNVILTGDNISSIPVRLSTGSLASLNKNPISVAPSQSITLGTRAQLTAALENSTRSYRFSWEAAPSPAGPFESLIGSSETINWEPQRTGSYYIRLTLTDTATQNTSTYLSPVPQVYVQAPDNIVITSPDNGTIIAGETVNLTAALPEYEKDTTKNDFQWFYSTSLQTPFQPIGETGRTISWEPPSAGAFYLRVQTRTEGRLSSYTTTNPEVRVSAADDIIQTTPQNGTVIRGQAINLSANVPNESSNSTYTWFYGFSPQGTFQAIAETGPQIRWTPPLTGEFFLRVRVFNPLTQDSRIYTSDKSLVSVRDSNQTFVLSPASGNVKKGETVQLTLAEAQSGEKVNWSFGTDPQQPFQSISASGKTITWTPTTPGRFYLRANITRANGSVANFTSADPLVFVSDQSDVITVVNPQDKYQLGHAVTLSSQITRPGLRYNWGYSTSAQGPFQPVQGLNNNDQQRVEWFPPQTGSYFIQLTLIDNDSQLQFVSPTPLVRVEETVPLFSTDPVNGRIEIDEKVRLFSTFQALNRSFNYGWAYSSSSAGPFIPLGGSAMPEFLWDTSPKPTGSYYIRLQATSPGNDNRVTFISSTPVVFISKNDQASNEFGTSITP
jgi:hypothetical protein